MNDSHILEFTALALTAIFCRPSFACSMAFDLVELEDSFVFVGEVVSYTEFGYKGNIGNGLTLRPVRVLPGASSKTEPTYDVFPFDLQTFCEPYPIADRSYLKRIAPVGTKIALVGRSGNSEMPGDLSVVIGQGFDPLDESCNLDDVIDADRNYVRFEVGCGSIWFHGQKDLARLSESSVTRRIDILGRLAEFPRLFEYEDVVRKYIPDEEDQNELLELRYDDLVKEGCAFGPAEISRWSTELWLRYFEFCE